MSSILNPPVGITMLLLASCAAIGCKELTKKFDNPVLIPAPRRVAMAQNEAGEGNDSQSSASIALASASDVGAEDDTKLYNAKVLVRINGAPVFAIDVLEKYGDVLRQARTQMPPEQFRELRENIIRRDIRSVVERQLLVETMKADFKPEQMKMLNEHLDKLFEREVDRLKTELKVSTRTELEYALNERGTSLQNIRTSFGNNRMAMEYLQMKAEKPKPVDRPELVEYYQSHIEEYRQKPRVRWQQIQLDFAAKGGEAQARKLMASIQADLANRKGFSELARQHSDGPTAREGGQWEWTQTGSLADKDLEAALFAQPVGKASAVIERPGMIQIVLVNDRKMADVVPFDQVQAEIEAKIQLERRPDPRKIIDAVLAKAEIEVLEPFADPFAVAPKPQPAE
jgi:parvulin-like peptidyl-prolyl isomerase